ncbi:hypothetical protein pb186bvf_007735 [Paramecium bursaria]
MMNPYKNTSDQDQRGQFIVTNHNRTDLKHIQEPSLQKKIKVKEETQQQELQSNKNNRQLLQQQYDQCCLKYSNEDYSYLSNTLLSRFAQKETSSSVATAFPLFKMLRGIVRKFMFNELEIIFFLHHIDDQQWKYDDSIIEDFLPHFKRDFLSTNELSSNDNYQKLLLFLLCCAFIIKCYFNDVQDQELILIQEHIQSHCSKDFKRFIDNYRSKNVSGPLKIVPRQINKLYTKLIKIPRDNSVAAQQDYNSLVDSIIQISPPYTSQEQKTIQKEKQEQPIVPTSIENFQVVPLNMTRRSSQIDYFENGFDQSRLMNTNQGDFPFNIGFGTSILLRQASQFEDKR